MRAQDVAAKRRLALDAGINPEELEFLEDDGKLDEWLVKRGLLAATNEAICRLFVPDRQREQFTEWKVPIRELSDYSGHHGSVVWPGALILAQWVLEHPSVVKSKMVIELGAGCGLTGIVAARHAARVLLTEVQHTELLENLRHNAAISGMPDKLRVQSRDWNESSVDSNSEKFDVALGAECIYSPKHAPALARTIGRILKPGGIFYGVSSADRAGFLAFWHTAQEEGLILRTTSLDAFRDDMLERDKTLGDGKDGTEQLPLANGCLVDSAHQSFILFTAQRRPQTQSKSARTCGWW